MTPRSSIPGATSLARPVPARRAARRMGDLGEARSRSSSSPRTTRPPATSRSRAITANGFVGRCFRSRSERTTAARSARQASWKPPSPLTATIAPSARAVRAAASAAAPSATDSPLGPSRRNRGPQAGQHTGSAWNRRSDGVAYSLAQSGQNGKQAMDVRSRSYGNEVHSEKRGPQFVQVVKAYWWRRSLRSSISRRQSAQTTASGGTRAPLRTPRSDSTTRNSRAPSGPIWITSSASRRASGGSSRGNESRKRSTASSGPSISTMAPSGLFLTQPASPRFVARRWAAGRNPTP